MGTIKINKHTFGPNEMNEMESQPAGQSTGLPVVFMRIIDTFTSFFVFFSWIHFFISLELIFLWQQFSFVLNKTLEHSFTS